MKVGIASDNPTYNGYEVKQRLGLRRFKFYGMGMKEVEEKEITRLSLALY